MKRHKSDHAWSSKEVSGQRSSVGEVRPSGISGCNITLTKRARERKREREREGEGEGEGGTERPRQTDRGITVQPSRCAVQMFKYNTMQSTTVW